MLPFHVWKDNLNSFHYDDLKELRASFWDFQQSIVPISFVFPKKFEMPFFFMYSAHKGSECRA